MKDWDWADWLFVGFFVLLFGGVITWGLFIDNDQPEDDNPYEIETITVDDVECVTQAGEIVTCWRSTR